MIGGGPFVTAKQTFKNCFAFSGKQFKITFEIIFRQRRKNEPPGFTTLNISA
jgi:hypothetical protein